MEWHKRTTWYQRADMKQFVLPGESEPDFLFRVAKGLNRTHGTTKEVEGRWAGDGKPYYKVWDSISDGLMRVRLNVPCSCFRDLMAEMPGQISVRFPVGHEPQCGSLRLREALVSRYIINKNGLLYEGVEVQADTGETDESGGTISNCIAFRFTAGTVEDAITLLRQEGDVTLNDEEENSCVVALRIFLGIAMLHDNPDFVDAVVLRKDAAKYAVTRDPKYVEKAKRRGEYGWNVGANIEVLPHFRRPHFAIRWTGKGAEVPKLVPVKGCVVKRSKFTDVPTGYQVDEELAASAHENAGRRPI